MAETKKKEEEVQVKTTKATTKRAPAKTKEEPAKRKITGDTEVVVYNNTHGGLVYSAKKGTGYLNLETFMDSDVMTVDELQQMRNGARRMLEEGWIYVDDEDVLDYLRLDKVKESVKSPEFLKELLLSNNPTKVKEVASNLSTGSQTTLYKELRRLYRDGEVANIHIINAIEDLLNVAPENSLINE